MNTSSIFSSLAALVIWLAVPSVWADDVYIWAEESGTDVIFYFEGAINLAGFPAKNPSTTSSGIIPSSGTFISADTSGGNVPADFYGGVTPGAAAQAYGSGGADFTLIVTGNVFGFDGPTMILPANYASGAPLSGSSRFTDESFATLGIDPTPKSFATTAGANTIFLFSMPPLVVDNSALKLALQKKIKKLAKKAKAAKKKGKSAKAKKLGKKVKTLKARLRALG